MLILGISGQTGAGKSTLAEYLAAKGIGRNVEVDALGHLLLKQQSTISKLTEAFGDDILINGQIDRKKLGAKAFVSSEATEKLNSIMHPAMVLMAKEIIAEEEAKGASGIIINAALLYKMKLDKLCNRIIYVEADPEIRVRRLVESRGFTEENARARLFSQDQRPDDSRVIIIENNGTADELKAKLDSADFDL